MSFDSNMTEEQREIAKKSYGEKLVHVHSWQPLSCDPESNDICSCGAERSIRTGKIYDAPGTE